MEDYINRLGELALFTLGANYAIKAGVVLIFDGLKLAGGINYKSPEEKRATRKWIALPFPVDHIYMSSKALRKSYGNSRR